MPAWVQITFEQQVARSPKSGAIEEVQGAWAHFHFLQLALSPLNLIDIVISCDMAVGMYNVYNQDNKIEPRGRSEGEQRNKGASGLR